jgi:NADH dehydrogenase
MPKNDHSPLTQICDTVTVMQIQDNAKKVIIVGGGFAGLRAAKILGSRSEVSVEIFDKKNHHLFQPLLYQVAMAGLNPSEISSPIRSEISKHANIRVVLGEIEKVDIPGKRVKSPFGWHEYDYLILATGTKTSYFGKSNWEEFAPGLKSLEDAIEVRRRVLWAFEQAEASVDPEIRKQFLTFIVVGGGPTGVELAGALGEISKYTLAKDFRNIDPARTRIILIESGPRILSSFPDSLSQRAARDLEALGIQIWYNSPVSNINERGIQVGDQILLGKTVLWAAGIQQTMLTQSLPTEKSRSGQVKVRHDLSLPSAPEIFVLGDMAFVDDDRFPAGLPGIAPVALQQGQHAAENILAELNGHPRKPFRYLDKGSLATIGRHRAVAQIGSFRLQGALAWWLWLGIHIFYLIGFKNRIFVFLQWAWQYFSYRRGARIILQRNKPPCS